MRFTSEISELDLNLYGDDPSEMIDEVESSMSEEEDCDDSSRISGSPVLETAMLVAEHQA
jgi:hypothetical protein